MSMHHHICLEGRSIACSTRFHFLFLTRLCKPYIDSDWNRWFDLFFGIRLWSSNAWCNYLVWRREKNKPEHRENESWRIDCGESKVWKIINHSQSLDWNLINSSAETAAQTTGRIGAARINEIWNAIKLTFKSNKRFSSEKWKSLTISGFYFLFFLAEKICNIGMCV